MLGSMVTDFLSRDKSLSVTATLRSSELIAKAQRLADNVEWRIFEIKNENRTVQQFQEFLWILIWNYQFIYPR